MKHYGYLTMSGTFSFHRLASSHRVLGQHQMTGKLVLELISFPL